MSEHQPGPSADIPETTEAPAERQSKHPGAVSGADFIALHTRVIALENLVIAMLAVASERQLEVAREMASYIAPRPGFTAHRLTVHAAAHMVDIVERAARFRGEGPREQRFSAVEDTVTGGTLSWQGPSKSETT